MCSLDTLCKSLQKEGLFTKMDDTGDCFLIAVQNHDAIFDDEFESTTRYCRKVNIERWNFGDSPIYLEDVCYVRRQNNQLDFQNTIPPPMFGINLDIIKYETDKFEDCYSKVSSYFLRPPVEIDQWLFPLHQQPKWNHECIVKSVLNPEHITMDQLKSHNIDALNAYEKTGGEVGKLLYPVIGKSAKSERLFLQYNCKKAFIVKG